MAIRPIVTVPNPVLLTKTEEITSIDQSVVELARDLTNTLNNAHDPEGAGIAANQIGVLKRMCVVKNFMAGRDRELAEDFILINPKIIYKSKEMDTDWEGCLSVPDKYGKVSRNLKIKVEAQTLDGNTIQLTAKDLFARVIQHEVDHLDGILFTSKVIGKTLTEKELDDLYE
jgi:peptide deformylase